MHAPLSRVAAVSPRSRDGHALIAAASLRGRGAHSSTRSGLKLLLLFGAALRGCAAQAIVARSVRVAHPDGIMNLAEIQVWDEAGTNVARDSAGGTASASSALTNNPQSGCPNNVAPNSDFYATTVNNGVLYSGDGLACTWNMWHSSPSDACAHIAVTFAADAAVASIDVYLRFNTPDDAGCCQSRDIGDTVQLLNATGDVVWSGVLAHNVSVYVGGRYLPVWSAAIDGNDTTAAPAAMVFAI